MTDALFEGTRPPAIHGAAGGRTAPRVIGLDISLASTGVAGAGWTDLIRPGKRNAEARLDFILGRCAEFYRQAEFIVLEGPAFSHAKQIGHDELAAARWIVRCDLRRRGIPYAIVPPDNRTIYATGRARWKDEDGRKLTAAQVKGKVREAAALRYGMEFEGVGRYDRADAYVLLAMALDYLGHPLASVPTTHSRALAKVAWPEVVA